MSKGMDSYVCSIDVKKADDKVWRWTVDVPGRLWSEREAVESFASHLFKVQNDSTCERA